MKQLKGNTLALAEVLALIDRADGHIKDARREAKRAHGFNTSSYYESQIWKELVRAEANIQEAIKRLSAKHYSELFYPTVQYDHMHDYEQPDGIARKPEKPTKRKRHT